MTKVLWETYLVRFTIEGITPILQHNPSKSMRPAGGLGRKRIPTPEVEAEDATYRFPDGTLGMPAIAMRSSILTGSSGLKLGKQSVMKFLAAALEPTGDELFPLVDAEGNGIKTYEIDQRHAVVQNQGIIRARPKIYPWRLACVFKMVLPEATDINDFIENTLGEVINASGRYPGLGDGRPEKKKGMGLWFGKYKLVEITAEKIEE